MTLSLRLKWSNIFNAKSPFSQPWISGFLIGYQSNLVSKLYVNLLIDWVINDAVYGLQSTGGASYLVRKMNLGWRLNY